VAVWERKGGVVHRRTHLGCSTKGHTVMAIDGEIDFRVAIDHRDGGVVVKVIGEVDLATAPSLWETIIQAMTMAPDLIVDLSETTFLDSSGLKVIVDAYKRLGEVDGSIVLRAPPGPVRRVLHITGLDRVLQIDDGA
jgi:anti-sigma B factor antagonist